MSVVVWRLLLGVSFLPLLIKACGYAVIGSYLPLFVFGLFGAAMALGIYLGDRAEALVVRTWTVAMVLWGLVRLGLRVLGLFLPLNEAHIEGQFGLWYVLLSLAYIVLGVFLFRAAGGQRLRHLPGGDR